MFDIGWQELFILAVLAIIVIGPRDLPRTVRTVTQWIRKLRGMARDLQYGVDEMVREAELNDIKEQANSIMVDEFDPAGTITREFDMTDEENDWSKAVNDFKDSTEPDRTLEENAEEMIAVEYENIASTGNPSQQSEKPNSEVPEDTKTRE